MRKSYKIFTLNGSKEKLKLVSTFQMKSCKIGRQNPLERQGSIWTGSIVRSLNAQIDFPVEWCEGPVRASTGSAPTENIRMCNAVECERLYIYAMSSMVVRHVCCTVEVCSSLGLTHPGDSVTFEKRVVPSIHHHPGATNVGSFGGYGSSVLRE